jgi:hypothetical protein
MHFDFMQIRSSKFDPLRTIHGKINVTTDTKEDKTSVAEAHKTSKKPSKYSDKVDKSRLKDSKDIDADSKGVFIIECIITFAQNELNLIILLPTVPHISH